MEDFYQRVAEKCLLKYKQISKRRKRNDRQWTPLASVVQHTLTGGAREPYSYTAKPCSLGRDYQSPWRVTVHTNTAMLIAINYCMIIMLSQAWPDQNYKDK